jgi:hypothetical protein
MSSDYEETQEVPRAKGRKISRIGKHELHQMPRVSKVRPLKYTRDRRRVLPETASNRLLE